MYRAPARTIPDAEDQLSLRSSDASFRNDCAPYNRSALSDVGDVAKISPLRVIIFGCSVLWEQEFDASCRCTLTADFYIFAGDSYRMRHFCDNNRRLLLKS